MKKLRSTLIIDSPWPWSRAKAVMTQSRASRVELRDVIIMSSSSSASSSAAAMSSFRATKRSPKKSALMRCAYLISD